MRTVKEIFNDYEKKFNETIAIPRTCLDIEEFLEEVEKCIKENRKIDEDKWYGEHEEGVLY
mgnify:FL=1